MHVGAIITVSRPFTMQGESSDGDFASPVATWDVLGSSVLARMVDRLRIAGVSEISVLYEGDAPTLTDSSSQAITSDTEWRKIAARYLGYGLKTLLLVRVGAYVELDVSDLLRFHRERSGSITQACDQQGELDVLAVDAKHLHGTGWLRSGLKSHARYSFRGYVNRLKDIQSYRQLVKDALVGRAGIRPIGREVAPDVWANDGARLHQSAHIVGPAYFGKDSNVHSGCSITGASSIEQSCEVDCGTTVEDSCILPGTYLGMALHVRSAVASGQTLFHLGRNVQLQFHDRKIIGNRISQRGLLQQARSFLSVSIPALRDGDGQPATSNWHL